MPELYFDYAATTPIDDRVIEDMLAHMGRRATFGNPASSSHRFGQLARLAVERARGQVAALVGSTPEALVWTSGATESNNLAIKGVADSAPAERRHIITSRLEHKAVLDTVRQLEARGFEVTWLSPDAQGLIQPQAVDAALRDDTLLVSLMLVNNELGTVTDVAAIGEAVRARGALLHVDAAQATGKVAIDLARWPVDLMSFSAHKTYGPKGIGALYVGERAYPQLQAQIHGGGHERGLRSGTLATHQIVGMGSAFALAASERDAEHAQIAALSARLRDGLLALPGVSLNGHPTQRIPHTLNLCIDREGFDVTDLAGSLALSSTSACNSASSAASHVLLALGLDTTRAQRSLRLSLGRYSSEEEVDTALKVIGELLGA
ncbi:MAG: Cysteine desulfurase IscS [Pseudomonas citronellolis]|nr:MAG: Cysteine desulfurase IscS [Pseudomonas citronellolis]